MLRESQYSLVIAGLLLLYLQPIEALERYSIARSADLVIVGRLGVTFAFPWFDGWHFRGRLRSDEVLFGATKRGVDLDYRFVCSCCPLWPEPPLRAMAGRSALWFLKRTTEGRWESPGNCFDPGYRPLQDRDDFRKFFMTWRPSLP
jgi:hypothetical protein